LEPRLASRFESGLPVEIQTPNMETRLAILQQKRKEWKVNVSDNILQFLADRIRQNVRRLEGGLMRIATYASISGTTPDVVKAETLLRDILREENQKQVSIDAIQKRVSEEYDIRLADMVSRRRPARIAYPRQIAMYLCRTLTNASLQEIGDAFGGRDHGTVIHANKTIEARMQEDASLKDRIEHLKEELR
jgi:chromosomal replication initiator protein